MSTGWGDVLAPGIVVVSGKGGTGKSTVAAALAMAAARRGRRTLLVEVEGRGEVRRTLHVPDPGSSPRETAWGFSVLSITPRDAVREYLARNVRMRRVPRPLLQSRVLDQIVTWTPGLRDLLALGVVGELIRPGLGGVSAPRERRRAGIDGRYDVIVVDAPPIGQVAAFLKAPATVAGLVRMGPVRTQAERLARVVRSQARVVIVAVLEEMSVTETLEWAPAVRATGVALQAVVANRVPAAILAAGAEPGAAPSVERARRLVAATDLPLGRTRIAQALQARREAHEIAASRRPFLERLEEAAPVLALPDLSGAPSPDPVPSLAAMLTGGTPGPYAEGNGADGGRTSASPAGSRRRAATLGETLAEARVIVVCGSGGTGKTTISAAVAVHLATKGRRTALLTVDPARRLATALGLGDLPGGSATVDLGDGRTLEALQLDTKRTFDELVERFAGSPQQRERILSNPVYERISDTLAGTHEYMAMEKLHQLAERPDHEAIVVDTPPTPSALGFLDAPRRLTELLGGRFLRWMLWPGMQVGKAGASIGRFGAEAFRRTVGRIVGAEVLSDTVEFLTAFQGMYGGFADRAARVLALMRSPACAFVIVATPSAASLEEAALFVERLDRAGMRAAALVVNRCHRAPGRLPQGVAAAAARLLGGTAEERVIGEGLAEQVFRARRSAREAEPASAFVAAHPETPMVRVPELARDVHDLAGLRQVGEHLFGAGRSDSGAGRGPAAEG